MQSSMPSLSTSSTQLKPKHVVAFSLQSLPPPEQVDPPSQSLPTQPSPEPSAPHVSPSGSTQRSAQSSYASPSELPQSFVHVLASGSQSTGFVHAGVASQALPTQPAAPSAP